MKILIVYEEIPESTKVYSEDVTAEEWAWMKLTHGNYVNADADSEEAEEACTKLSDWLVDKKPASDSGEQSEPILLRGVGYDYVIVTGFILCEPRHRSLHARTRRRRRQVPRRVRPTVSSSSSETGSPVKVAKNPTQT